MMNTATLTGLRTQLQQWKERFEALSLRERALVTLACVAILYLLWDNLFFTPIHKQMAATSTQLEALNSQLAELDAQIESMAGSQASEGVIIEQIAQVETRLQQLRQQQNRLMGDFITPSTMVRVLRDLLQENGLILVRMESGAAQPLFADTQEQGAQAGTAGTGVTDTGPNIYRHSLTMELEGDYFTALKYLQALEHLPWRFYWDEIRYQVHAHPRARITITLYTLSLEEGWIGV